MTSISLADISRDPSEFLRRVEAGEEIVLLRDEQPVAEVKSIERPAIATRPYGLAAQNFAVPENFDTPLPDEVVEDFEGR